MPDPKNIPLELDFNLAEVRKDAGIGPGDDMVNRVGSLFELLIRLIKQADNKMLIAAPDTYQGDPGTWRAAVNGLVLSKVTTLPEALKLVEQVAEQGEGVTLPTTGDKSHFEDLYGIYKAAKAVDDPNVLPVPVNPTLDDDEAEGYISHPEARLWADVFNHRFRWTLASIGSHLFLPAGSDRSTLSQWSFQDMFLLSDIAEHLLSLPLDTAGTTDAKGRSMVSAPPFQLPYSLSLPDRARLIWLHQKMMLDHSVSQMGRVTEPNFVSAQIGLLDAERADFIDQVLTKSAEFYRPEAKEDLHDIHTGPWAQVLVRLRRLLQVQIRAEWALGEIRGLRWVRRAVGQLDRRATRSRHGSLQQILR